MIEIRAEMSLINLTGGTKWDSKFWDSFSVIGGTREIFEIFKKWDSFTGTNKQQDLGIFKAEYRRQSI